ncbi:hypothetical protein ACO34A_23710 (plasmid) [Rhizobium sp. ACO-34A]|nr:hypothetical protein ACO34A_23710 [Rhizobium sp. ACO-34A]
MRHHGLRETASFWSLDIHPEPGVGSVNNWNGEATGFQYIARSREWLLQDEQAALRQAAFSPSGFEEAEAWIRAPDGLRIDVGIAPLTRPHEISDGVSLSDKLGRAVRAFVAEDGAVDALFAASIDELPPDEHGRAVGCSKHDLLAGAGEEPALASMAILPA